MYPLNHSRIKQYETDYLLEPMELNMRLQFDPLSNQAKVSLVVQRLEILMREK
jgi:hypothetical protein